MRKLTSLKLLTYAIAFLLPVATHSTIAKAYVCSAPTSFEQVKSADVLFTGKLLLVESVYLPVPDNALKQEKRHKRTLSRILTFKMVQSYKGPKNKTISVKCNDNYSWCSKLVVDNKTADKVYIVDGQIFPSPKRPYQSSNMCGSNKTRSKNFKQAEPYLNELLRFPKFIDQMIRRKGSMDKTGLNYTLAKWYEVWGDDYRAAATWQILIDASEYKNARGAKLYDVRYVEKKLRNLLSMRDYEAVVKVVYGLEEEQKTIYTRHAGELALLFLGHNFDARQINFSDLYIGSIDLSNKDFRGIDLSSTTFSGTDLSGARFEGADLRAPDPFGNGFVTNFSKATYSCQTKFPNWFRYRHLNYVGQMTKTDSVCKNKPRVTKE